MSFRKLLVCTVSCILVLKLIVFQAILKKEEIKQKIAKEAPSIDTNGFLAFAEQQVREAEAGLKKENEYDNLFT